MRFKNEDKYYNHVRNSKCNFRMEAQAFAGVDELRQRCRNNTYRRRLVKNLILHTEFWEKNSLLRQLDLKVWPAFTETSPQRLLRSYTLSNDVKCIIHTRDSDAQRIWQKIAPHVLEAEFGIDVRHKLDDPRIARMFDSISGLLETLHVGTDVAGKVLSLVCKLLILCKMSPPDWLVLSAWIYDVAFSFGMTAVLIKALIGRVQQHFTNPNGFEGDAFVAQGPGMSLGWFSTIIDIFSAIFFKTLPSFSFVSGIVKAGSFARGITNIWQLIDKVTVEVFPKLYTHITGFPYELEELKKQFSGLETWYKSVQDLVNVELDNQIALDKEICERIQRLYREGLQYAVMAQELKLDHKSIQALNHHFAVIRMMYDKVQASGAFQGGPRPEPLVIHLYGDSGVGKSGMMYPLAIDLLKIEGIPNGKWAQEIYARAVEQEFWDGYKSQRIVLYDDFGQKVDTVQSPNDEFFEIIRTGNLAPYPLHMASLLEKSKTFFTSKVVLLSSNISCFRPVSLTCPEAVRRRIDISVKVCVRPEFRTGGKMDPAKVYARTGKCVSTEPYMFYLLNPETGYHTNENPLTYDELRELCVEKYCHKFTRTEKVLQEYNQMAAQSGDLPMVNQRVLDWTESEVREFVMTTFAYADILTDDCRYKIAKVDFPQIGYEGEMNLHYQVWSEWRDWLHENLELRPGASDLLKEEYKVNKKTADEMEMPLSEYVGVRHRFYEFEEEPVYISWQMRKLLALKEKCVASAAILKEQLAKYVDKAIAFAKEHPFITAAVVALPLLTLMFRSSSEEETVSELAASGDPKTQKSTTLRTELSASGDPRTQRGTKVRTELAASGDPKTSHGKKITTEAYEAELLRDENAFNLSRKIASNMYCITPYNGTHVLGTLRGFFVRGRIFMTVRHLMPLLSQASHVKIWNISKPDGFTIPVESLKSSAVKDITGNLKDQVLLECPRLVHDHADIMESFIDSDGLSATTRYRGLLLTPDHTGLVKRFGNVDARDTEIDYVLKAANDIPEIKFKIRKRYIYDMETTKGDCGSPLIAISNYLPKKLIGMHIAGATGLGMSTPFNRREIDEAMKELSKDAQVELDTEEMVAHLCFPDEVKNVPAGNFTPLGSSKYFVRGSEKTSIRPSVIHNEVKENVTIPAVLGPMRVGEEVVDPMMKGLQKCGVLSEPLNQDYLDAAVKDYERNFIPDPTRQRVLSDWEAVVGIEGDEFAPPIKRSTAPGYPFRSQNRMPGKTYWLGKDEYKLDDELKKLMHQRVSDALNNKRTPTIWSDTLKDERRPIEKVNQGKTRVFAGGPIDFSLVFRQYFLGFSAHVSHHRNLNEISVGTNVYSQDWTIIADLMSQKGKNVIAGDFSNFDGTLHVEILHRLVDIINGWYNDGEDNEQVRKILWREILNSIHVCRDTIYMWTHSQPSGCPLTAVLNSMYNSIACRYVWMIVTKGTSFHTMKSFREHVTMVSYGDDNLLNVSDTAIEFYNQISMATAFSTFGMTYTDEVKSGQMVPCRTLPEVQYLKRRFVWNDERCLYDAPLALDTVLEIPNWIRQCVDYDEATTSNIEGAVFELSVHGKEVFDEWVPKLVAAAKAKGLSPQILTFYEYRVTELEKYGQITAKTEMSCDLLDHNHEGLPRGVREHHAHGCTSCGKTFWHTHRIKSYEESIKYPLLCKTCFVTARK